MRRRISRPSVADMPADLQRGMQGVAERLRSAGHRAWLVGGAVRDLALGIAPHDADLATAAVPEEVESLFERTHAVGKRFGTILVAHAGVEIQVTTFRTESGYTDARRPDAVRYGHSVEEDAERRDFTCNAIYLDPSTDELVDPVGGLADLEAGVLRCVGDPLVRFAEDGLRLLRLARFAAGYDLEVEPATLEAARRRADAIVGVSRERVRAELELLARGPRPARGLSLLAETGVWTRILPPPAGGTEAALAAAERLGPRPGPDVLLALLLAPSEGRSRAEEPAGVLQPERGTAALEGLRTSRELQRAVRGLWELEARLEGLLRRGRAARRSERVRLVREEGFPAALQVWRARHPDARGLGPELAELLAFERSLAPAERFPPPFLESRDLEEAGVERGPRWGELLREAEDRLLDGEDGTRAEALAWLRRIAASS